jgi:DNA polymerase epsilon subunit 3
MEEDKENIADKLLPMGNVAKVLKQALPEGVSLSKDVKKVMQQAGSVFVMYITTIANEIANEKQGKRKKPVISTEHILQALDEMEFRSIAKECGDPSLT